MARKKPLAVRAVRAYQGQSQALFAFFMPGNLITQIADISRVGRDESDGLQGFQRKAIRTHIKQITEYLDQGPVLFPNAILLALSPNVKFSRARGRDPEGIQNVGEIGTLTIPWPGEEGHIAWIVDGQQRSLALSESKNGAVPVPVIAFIGDLKVQREQFILVNKAKPLPTRLINELLPEVDVHLPKDLAARKIPSGLCRLLSADPASPFHKLVRFESEQKSQKAIVSDSALVESIRNSIANPLGALSQYKARGQEPADIEAMYRTLVTYWDAVKTVFPEAWGKPPSKSRLMHGAGIKSMGTLMDHIMPRTYGASDPQAVIHTSLNRIAHACCWTAGTWDDLGIRWNQVQNTPKHVKDLAGQLVRLDYEALKDHGR
jgi:DGQHR domain-containing protein